MTSTELAVIPASPAELRARVPVVTRVAKTDMAWMAGVIDLRGAVIRKSNRSRRTPQLVLYCAVKEERVALRLSSLTGTSPEQRESPSAEAFTRRGCTEHCPEPHVHVHEDGPYPWSMPLVTRWSLTGVAAAVVLLNLAPYMTTFGDYAGHVAEMVVNFAARGQGSGASRAAVARLERLGWKIPPQVASRMKNDREDPPRARSRKDRQQEEPVMPDADGSEMPAADPSDPEVRLLRAVFGLCPDCDSKEPHSHEGDEDQESERESVPQKEDQLLELKVTVRMPWHPVADLDERVARIAADKGGVMLAGRENDVSVDVASVERADGQALGLEAEFRQYWEETHSESDPVLRAEAHSAFLYGHRLGKGTE